MTRFFMPVFALLFLLGIVSLTACPTNPRDDDDSASSDDDDDSASSDDDDVADDDDSGSDCSDGDALEDNDTFDTPAAVAPGEHADLEICTDDPDYFAVDVSAGDELTVDLTFLNDNGDIDMAILRGDGLGLAYSSSATDNESASTVAEEDGTFIIEIELYSDEDGGGNGYVMTVAVETPEPPPPCDGDDAFEDNDTFEAPNNTLTTGAHTGLKVCSYDDDYYSLDLEIGSVITVDVSFSNDAGDIDLRLLDEDELNEASSLSLDDNESLTATITTGGTYTIRVNLFAEEDEVYGNTYDMSVAIAMP